jgi:SAM-dependent methyltransferase
MIGKMPMAGDRESEYWSAMGLSQHLSTGENLWRAHLQWIYHRLLLRWQNPEKSGLILKTDLYDEAVSPYNFLSLCGPCYDRMIGIDISHDIAATASERAAKESERFLDAVVCDVKKLPFRSREFDQILSISTLDHFRNAEDLKSSLRELHRILRPGGEIIVTLDNPINPLIWIRNLLPYRLLKSIGLIPFYMGVTVSKATLGKMLEECGFRLQESTVIVHSPRILGIWAGNLLRLQESGRPKHWFHWLFRKCELLERLPTSQLTGYYAAIKALRNSDPICG